MMPWVSHLMVSAIKIIDLEDDEEIEKSHLQLSVSRRKRKKNFVEDIVTIFLLTAHFFMLAVMMSTREQLLLVDLQYETKREKEKSIKLFVNFDGIDHCYVNYYDNNS